MSNIRYTVRVESWATSKGKRGKVTVRDQFGRFHGATNFAQLARVGQVATSRRK